MRVLALDTTGDPVSCALANSRELIGELYLHVKQKHSVTLMPAIDDLLQLANVDVEELDALGVVRGPGSFTGVRIGVATASGLGFGLGIPIWSVSTLDALIAGTHDDAAVCALLDARRNEVYVKAVDGQEVLIPESAQPLAAVLEEVAGAPHILFTGDGAIRYRHEIREAMPRARFMPDELSRCRAGFVFSAIARGMADKVTFETLKPVYIRPSQAERLRTARPENPHA